MSTCISSHGEYDEHETGENFVCDLCGEFDETGALAEIERLRGSTQGAVMSDSEDYLIRRYGGLNPNDWFFSDPSHPGSKVYDDGSPLPPGQTPINLAPLPLEGELISTPPEPPRDHVIVSYRGDVWLWSDSEESWLGVDSEHGATESWEDICRYNSRLTIYRPVREIP